MLDAALARRLNMHRVIVEADEEDSDGGEEQAEWEKPMQYEPLDAGSPGLIGSQ